MHKIASIGGHAAKLTREVHAVFQFGTVFHFERQTPPRTKPSARSSWDIGLDHRLLERRLGTLPQSHPRFKGWRRPGLGWKLYHHNPMKRLYTIVSALVLANSNLVQTANRRQRFFGQAPTLIFP
jgi:hypothetical protein